VLTVTIGPRQRHIVVGVVGRHDEFVGVLWSESAQAAQKESVEAAVGGGGRVLSGDWLRRVKGSVLQSSKGRMIV